MKQIPSQRGRGRTTPMLYGDDYYYGGQTNTNYLNKHAKEWKPPFGHMHLHLIFARTVHWRIVDRASSVCRVPGRCHRAFVAPAFIGKGD